MKLRTAPRRTLCDEVTQRIREAIYQGVLPPDTPLVERDLAESLGVSRVPIREAIQTLVEEGMVKKYPRRGAFVYALSREEIEEIGSLRTVLEQFAVERVLSRWDRDKETRLRTLLEAMREAAQRGQVRQVSDLDAEFHRALWQMADHGMLLEVASGLYGRLRRFLYEVTGSLSDSELQAHVDDHFQLLAALKSRDITVAQQAITQHIRISDLFWQKRNGAHRAGDSAQP